MPVGNKGTTAVIRFGIKGALHRFQRWTLPSEP
jgi:hypothetical protein